MATCRWCAKGGLFRFVDSNGLCGDCRPLVLPVIVEQGRLTRDVQRVLNRTPTLRTRVARLQMLIDVARVLQQYEERGIPTILPPPSELIRSSEQELHDAVLDNLTQQFEAARSKASYGLTRSARVNPLSKVIVDLERAQKDYHWLPSLVSDLDALEAQARELHRAERLAAVLEDAERAEFKGQAKKALDLYQEALFLVRRDDVADTQQADLIAEIESKLAALK